MCDSYNQTTDIDSDSVLKFNSYKVGAWNSNGWFCKTCPENYLFKKGVVLSLDLDIYLLSETHLMGKEVLRLTGFQIIQVNRKNYFQHGH